jgi:hypothetical protein
MDVKAQRKYCTLKVAIVLNDPYMRLLNREDWTVPLDRMLVRWFPGTWNLQQRKEREKFQAILPNIPDDVKTETLFVDAIFH